MSLEDTFNDQVTLWKEHCESVRYSSNPRDYLDCDAYREIISMGKPVLPLIRDLYEKFDDDSFPITEWPAVIRQITGTFSVPHHLRGDVLETKDYTVRWLNDYLSP